MKKIWGIVMCLPQLNQYIIKHLEWCVAHNRHYLNISYFFLTWLNTMNCCPYLLFST